MAKLTPKLRPKNRPKLNRTKAPTPSTDWADIARREHRRWQAPKSYGLSEAATNTYYEAVLCGYRGHMRTWTDVIETADDNIPRKILECIK